MSAQSVLELRPTAARSAAVSSQPHYIPATVISICDLPGFSPAPEVDEEELKENRDGLGCARGIRAAFFLEGAFGLLIYGIWHFWHLAR